MDYKNIGYHTRLFSDNTKKVCGGSFGGSLDLETANRLVIAHFSVVIKNSGRAVFVDREGREVTLYISVDADQTEKGKAAKAQWHKDQAAKEAEEEARQAHIERLMDSLSHEEIVRRLS